MAVEGSQKLLLSEWSAVLETNSGLRVNIRPASPDDEKQVLEFLKAVSEDDLRFRFLGAIRPSEPLARFLTEVDHSRIEDLLAFDASDGTLTATAMIAAQTSTDVAEVAIVIRSDLKNRGLGWTLLRHACDYAKSRGFRRLECVELSENRAAVTLELEQGFTRQAYPGDATVTLLSKDLRQA